MISFDLYKTNIGFRNSRNPTHIIIGQDGKPRLGASTMPNNRAYITRNDVRFCRKEGVIIEQDAALRPHIYGFDEESPNEASQETNNERVKGDLKECLFGEHDKMNRSFCDNFTVTVRNTSLNTVERTLNLKLEPRIINLSTEPKDISNGEELIDNADRDSVFGNEETLEEYISKNEKWDLDSSIEQRISKQNKTPIDVTPNRLLSPSIDKILRKRAKGYVNFSSQANRPDFVKAAQISINDSRFDNSPLPHNKIRIIDFSKELPRDDKMYKFNTNKSNPKFESFLPTNKEDALKSAISHSKSTEAKIKGGGDGDEICGDSCIFVFQGFKTRRNLLLEPRKATKKRLSPQILSPSPPQLENHFEFGKMTGRKRNKLDPYLSLYRFQINSKDIKLVEEILFKIKQKKVAESFIKRQKRERILQRLKNATKAKLYMGRSPSRDRKERSQDNIKELNMKNRHVSKCMIGFSKSKDKSEYIIKEKKNKKGMSFVQLLAEHGFLDIGIKAKSRYMDGVFNKPLSKKILESGTEYASAEIFEL